MSDTSSLHRPTLGVGLLIIIVMCLFPPLEVGGVAGDLAQAVSGEQIRYRPIWDAFDSNQNSDLLNVQIAATRLLLQILVVSVVTFITAYLVGNR